MRVSRRIAAVICAMPLGSCAVFGPVVDRSMDDAPFSACGRFEAAADAAAPQCITFLRPDPEGRWLPSSSGSLATGDELIAIPSAAPLCRGGEYTHVVLSGSAAGAGEMRVAVPDGLGRGDRGRRLRWDGPRRRWAVPNIGTANHLPAGIRISMVAGEVALDEACFKSYHHLVRVPPRPPREGAEPHPHDQEH